MIKSEPKNNNKHHLNDVFGVSRDLPKNYVSRDDVDGKFRDFLGRKNHLVIYGSSKQGKTSLRKNGLPEDEYVAISCLNNWDLSELNQSILKQAGYTIQKSEKTSSSGQAMVKLQASAKANIPFIGGGDAEGNISGSYNNSREEVRSPIDIDPNDVNDIIRSLNEINFKKRIVLEDFHYLPEETQQNFAFALKVFHELLILIPHPFGLLFSASATT